MGKENFRIKPGKGRHSSNSPGKGGRRGSGLARGQGGQGGGGGSLMGTGYGTPPETGNWHVDIVVHILFLKFIITWTSISIGLYNILIYLHCDILIFCYGIGEN